MASLQNLPKEFDQYKDAEFVHPFGIKLVDVNGKKHWTSATEADYRKAEANRLNISEADVIINDPCMLNSQAMCVGQCANAFECKRMQYQNHFYCSCGEFG